VLHKLFCQLSVFTQEAVQNVYTASGILWSTVSSAIHAVRRAARVSVSCECKCLVECNSTLAQCIKHATNVAQIDPAARQDHLPGRLDAWHMHDAFSDTARNLGIVNDSELSLAVHVSSVCRSSYNQLCQLRTVVRLLPVHATKMLVQAFILCHLDYCNSLLYRINDGLLHHVQLVQNAAAHLVTGTRQCDHVTPLLRQLHWLPVWHQITSKIMGLVHQSLAGITPSYLADNCRQLLDVIRPPLRSGSNYI